MTVGAFLFFLMPDWSTFIPNSQSSLSIESISSNKGSTALSLLGDLSGLLMSSMMPEFLF